MKQRVLCAIVVSGLCSLTVAHAESRSVAAASESHVGSASTSTTSQSPTRPGASTSEQLRNSTEPSSETPSQAGGRFERHLLELTFGNAQLFFTQSLRTPTGGVDSQVIPVTAALFMAEWLALPRLSMLTLVGIPLETQSTVVDGELREEYVAPSAALGARVTLFSFDIFRESALELQLACLGGRTLGSLSGDRYYPLVASRLHFHTGEGFTLYLGNGYAFAEGTHSVIYGIGHRF